MKIYNLSMAFLLYAQTALSIAILHERPDGMQLTTNYGTVVFNEPVLIELIKSPAFERLRSIHQYGVTGYVHTEEPYNRYEHSLGVFFITRKFGAPLQEQVAALLHDVSHTIFSHIGDHLFNSDYQRKKSSYQDDIHEWYLQESGITAILARHGLDGVCSPQQKKCQPCFDQDLPDLCADRIEYNLHGGLIDGLISCQDILNIVQSLRFEHGLWYFTDSNPAKLFAIVSLQLSEYRWGGHWNGFVDRCACQALKRALAIGLITQQEVHFSIDDDIWQRLLTSSDREIQTQLRRMCNYSTAYKITGSQESDLFIRGKFSGTDPLVMTGNGLQRLSEIDNNYAAEYQRVKDKVKNGFYIAVTQ